VLKGAGSATGIFGKWHLGPRAMWPYRDWVIKALNDDLPSDRFTIEQLAGDLLPAPTKSQIIATAFHRNTLINEEGGSKPEQFRVESVIDRVSRASRRTACSRGGWRSAMCASSSSTTRTGTATAGRART